MKILMFLAVVMPSILLADSDINDVGLVKERILSDLFEGASYCAVYERSSEGAVRLVKKLKSGTKVPDNRELKILAVGLPKMNGSSVYFVCIAYPSSHAKAAGRKVVQSEVCRTKIVSCKRDDGGGFMIRMKHHGEAVTVLLEDYPWGEEN